MHALFSGSYYITARLGPCMHLSTTFLRRSPATHLLTAAAPIKRSGWFQAAASSEQQRGARSTSVGVMSSQHQHKRRRQPDGQSGAVPRETTIQDHAEDEPNLTLSQVAAALKGISTGNPQMYSDRQGYQASGANGRFTPLRYVAHHSQMAV